MSAIDQTVGEFGRSIGIDGLSFGQHNVVGLEVEATGDLFIERVGW